MLDRERADHTTEPAPQGQALDGVQARGPRLLVLASHAHRVELDDAVDPFRAALTGLVRTAATEWPSAWIRLVDVTPAEAPEPPADFRF